ncbi:tripartite tricarboxylate transporter TctB family protein [Bosea sp. BK604]|uniref:tripartite tricarboxylate transporter TctB family protein n=1 Tax=Bosea sp. BK604 TaxID=2512180 RepID=UPI00104DEA4F|nr:tripartite tricarboxylate transporter TctB family protein [Bosea sp. BK604]TCR63481.1 tripartite tricarboxylate transporter TctB family protein [Bosea sp. BK604]
MRPDLIVGAVTFLLGAVVAVEAHRIPDSGTDAIGPGTFPFFLGIIIALCGAATVFSALKSAPEAEDHEPVRWGVVWTAFVLLVAYTFALAYLGFPLATVILVPAMLLLLGTRDVKGISVSAVAVSGAVFLIFGKVLGVDLPLGLVFGG